MQEGCRFPPGKILHDLLQDECVACKRATKGISWRWRWRSPWQPRQQQRSTWQQRQQRRPRSPWEQRQHHGWALCRLFTGGLFGDCRDNGPPTASSLVPNMSAKKKRWVAWPEVNHLTISESAPQKDLLLTLRSRLSSSQSSRCCNPDTL